MRKRASSVLGVTGGIGGGKTTVARLFSELGAEVLDADDIAHSLLSPGKVYAERILRAFGREVEGEKGRIDRGRLARYVFGPGLGRPERRKRVRALGRILHPPVLRIIRERIRSARAGPGGQVLVIDAPLLLEAGLGKHLDALIFVKAARCTRFRRLAKSGRMAQAEAARRAEMQMPVRKKEKAADFVVVNEGSQKETRRQVKKLWQRLKQTR